MVSGTEGPASRRPVLTPAPAHVVSHEPFRRVMTEPSSDWGASVSRGLGVLSSVALLAVLLAACGSPPPQATRSPAATPSRTGSTLPFAPAVTPKPGEPFVGYWSGAWNPDTLAIPIEVLPRDKGYEVSLDGEPAVPVPLVRGHLLVSRMGQSPPLLFGGARVELLWRKGHCVLSLLEGPYAPRPQLVVLTRQGRAAYVRTVDGVADWETRHELFQLADLVRGWVLRTGHEPPAASQLHSDSAFVRWARSLVPAWSWPRNPFTGQPMSDGTDPGDFTDAVKGRSWKLIGHESGGGTFDALTGRPTGVPTERSPGT